MSDKPNTKLCPKCNTIKDFQNFSKNQKGEFGLYTYCKPCCKEFKKEYRKANSDKIKKYKQRVRTRESQREKERYQNDPEYRNKRLSQNRIRRRQEPAKQQIKFKLKTDVQYKLKKVLRNRAWLAIKSVKTKLNIELQKCAKTIELIGCSMVDLKLYIESKFKPGMSWENHGFGDNKWHIDHIIPCAAFDLTQEPEQRKCFHFSNLQPLWQKDNLRKRDTIF